MLQRRPDPAATFTIDKDQSRLVEKQNTVDDSFVMN
jgi:hypothetical protein